SPDMVFPSTACLVQRGLGCRQVGAFDVSASCSGFLYGLSMAQAMIQSGQAKTCLVVASEVKSRSLDLRDEATGLVPSYYGVKRTEAMNGEESWESDCMPMGHIMDTFEFLAEDHGCPCHQAGCASRSI